MFAFHCLLFIYAISSSRSSSFSSSFSILPASVTSHILLSCFPPPPLISSSSSSSSSSLFYTFRILIMVVHFPFCCWQTWVSIWLLLPPFCCQLTIQQTFSQFCRFCHYFLFSNKTHWFWYLFYFLLTSELDTILNNIFNRSKVKTFMKFISVITTVVNLFRQGRTKNKYSDYFCQYFILFCQK